MHQCRFRFHYTGSDCTTVRIATVTPRSGLNSQSFPNQSTLIPWLGYLPVPAFRCNGTGTSVAELCYVDRPERPTGMSVDRISRSSAIQAAKIDYLALIQPSVIVVIRNTVVITRPQWTPRNPGRSIIEGYKPGRPEVERKGRSRQPAPPVTCAAIPSTVVIGKPSPGFIGNPGPPPYRPIAPTTHRVWRPRNADRIRNPCNAIGFYVNPMPIPIQIGCSDIDVIRQILPAGTSDGVCIPPIGPFIPTIPTIVT